MILFNAKQHNCRKEREKEMTILQKVIEEMGRLMAAGSAVIAPENESLMQNAIVTMLIVNEEQRRLQEEAFQKMPWLRKAAERNA